MLNRRALDSETDNSAAARASAFAGVLRRFGIACIVLVGICVVVLFATYPDCAPDQTADYFACRDDQNNTLILAASAVVGGLLAMIILFSAAWVIELMALVTNNTAELIESIEDLKESLDGEAQQS